MIELNRMEVFKNEMDVNPSFSQPHENDHSCEDAVSREAAMRKVCAIMCGKLKSRCKDIADCGAVDAIKDLPSVTPKPKTGKWRTVPDWEWDEHYKCSNCGAEFALFEGTPKDNDYLFCPHCGSRNVMEEAANRYKM